MVKASLLADLLSKNSLKPRDKLLLCLGVDPIQPRSVSSVKELASNAGLRKCKTWNVSSYLSKSSGLAIRTNVGWELTTQGRSHIAAIVAKHSVEPIVQVATDLRKHLNDLQGEDTKRFLDEAIKCLENKLLRPSVVFSWIGAVSLLYDYVFYKKLTEFNAAALIRDPKWRLAKVREDLTRMKEYDFLQVIHSISVISKNVKEELEASLKLRNACGHPSNLRFAENRVMMHLEVLTLNVYTPFAKHS